MSIDKLCKATGLTLAIIGLSVARGFALEEQVARQAESQIRPAALEAIITRSGLETSKLETSGPKTE